MAVELKVCPFCGGGAQFHEGDGCDGCHYIHCKQCDAFFDFANGADPENYCESLEQLKAQCAIAWNRRHD